MRIFYFLPQNSNVSKKKYSFGKNAFRKWQNSVQTVTWNIIGHALLSTNFNIIHSHLIS